MDYIVRKRTYSMNRQGGDNFSDFPSNSSGIIIRNHEKPGVAFMTRQNLQKEMSLKENRSQMPATVFRSKSFAGTVYSRPRSAPSTPVLGETLRRATRTHARPPHRTKAIGIGSHKLKIPKLPQPNRTLLMFESVKKGIREFISATQDDIVQLRSRETHTSTAQGRLHEADKFKEWDVEKTEKEKHFLNSTIGKFITS